MGSKIPALISDIGHTLAPNHRVIEIALELRETLNKPTN